MAAAGCVRFAKAHREMNWLGRVAIGKPEDGAAGPPTRDSLRHVLCVPRYAPPATEPGVSEERQGLYFPLFLEPSASLWEVYALLDQPLESSCPILSVGVDLPVV
jgi:hypothetical protein